MIITKDGIVMLEKIMRSCAPTNANGGLQGKKYLHSLAVKGENMEFSEIVKNFSYAKNKYNVYRHLLSFARERKMAEMNAETILMFFGGIQHIKRAKKDMLENDLMKVVGDEYAKKYFISHILLPIRVTSMQENVISGTYSIDNAKITIHNLVPFKEEMKKITIGSKVLAHYASVIFANIDSETENKIILAQSKNNDFKKACHVISEKKIDQKKMFYFSWAKKVSDMFE